MHALASEQRTIDVASLGSECPSVDFRGLLSEISPGHRAPVSEYADQIRDMAGRRRLAWALERARARLEDSDVATVITDISAAVTKAVAGAGAGRLLSPEQAAEFNLGSNSGPSLSWAPDRFNNDFLQPVRGGEMVVVAARPSVGKTVICEMLVEHWARESGRPVLFASLEMGVAKLMARHRKRTGEAGAPAGVWYLDDARATTGGLRAAVAKVKMVTGAIAAVAVDYIGLLKDGGENENRRIAFISSELKALAREHDIPVLALSQLNRASARRDDPMPRLDDIRDSGAVEQDADICIGLHREIGSQYMQVKVLKNRDGQAGHTATLLFDEEHVVLS